MKTFIYKIVSTFLFLSTTFLYGNNIIESQPQLIFELQKLGSSNENLEIQVDFNKAVLHLKRDEYDEALKLFLKTSKVFEAPSLLNIGILYFKQNNKEKALEYFNQIYSKKTNLINQPYPFIASCYYLFELTKDDKYMIDLVTIFQNSDKLSEHKELITGIKDVILKELANRYLQIKDYENALGALNAMSKSLDFKKAMVYIKQNNFIRASSILEKLKDEEQNSDTLNKILWVLAYSDLKQNKFENANEVLDLINERKNSFTIHTSMPFEIFFNKDLYTHEEYYKGIIKFDEERKYDFIYYFAPFIFSDSKEIIYESVKGFIYEQDSSVQNLESMVEYNRQFLNLVKLDPILRVNELKKIMSKDAKAYNFYNLALAYAQINDFSNAFLNFEKAYKLSPGNKLYSIMYLITSNKIEKDLGEKQKDIIDKTIRDSSGLYVYFSKEIYRLFIDSAYENIEQSLAYEGTIFYKAIDFLNKMYENEPLQNHILLDEYERDPFVYLLKLVQRDKNEDDYQYFSRVQDEIPKKYNNNFIKSFPIVSKYYIDTLKALGIFKIVDFNIEGESSPSYLLTKAYSSLYLNRPNESIEILRKLKDDFSYENRFSMYLLVASYLEANRPEDASINISLIKALHKDLDTDFLTAIQLIQNMNINSAKQFLKKNYNNPYIDFKIFGFDEFMLSL